MIEKIFQVKHTDFYESFTPWFKEMKKTNAPREGIYILSTSKPVPRCLAEDANGVLYIGKGIILSSQSRIGKFINSLNETESIHEAGKRFNNNKILEKYPINSLTVKIILKEKSRELEKEHLENYQSKFGELPPLNNQN